jgi:Domain of unknown function (DUF4440)
MSARLIARLAAATLAATPPFSAVPAATAQEARTMSDDAAYLASPQAMADLRAINAQFIENYVRNDVAAHDALLHPEFLYISPTGKRVDRATYLVGWATGFDPDIIVYWDVRDELITLVGNVALVRATNRQVIRKGNLDTASMSTYTDTYIYENGRWRCLQAQINPVSAANEPGDDTIISVYLHGVKQARGGGTTD